MADEPETLEETQARLARLSSTPYGPRPGIGDAPEPDPARPDPYASPSFAPAPQQAAAIPGSKRPLAVIGGTFGVLVVAAVGGIVAFTAFAGGSSDDSLGGGTDDPVYSEEWQSFPGVSYIDPQVALDQASYEEVVVGAEALMAEYRDILTAEFGLVWSPSYEPYSGVESNGYGGDSMLYYYDTGSWQGQVRVQDAAARERVLELFTQLASEHGGDGVLLRNDIYVDDEESSLDQFGAVDREDQALWSFFDSFPSLAGMYLSSDVIDRSVPVDESFTGDYSFVYDESDDTLYVTVNGYVGGLLKEADRAAFEAALEPYGGDYTP